MTKLLQVTSVVLLFAGCLVELHAERRQEKSRLYHRLRKRQTASEELGPIPYTSRDSAPLPYHQSGGGRGRNSNGNSQSTRYPGSYPGSYPGFGQVDAGDDWLASSDYARPSYSSHVFSSSQPGQTAQAQDLESPGRPVGSGVSHHPHPSPVSAGHRLPTQTHVSGTTRYTFTRPAAVPGGVREQGRTYTYPFGRLNGGGVSAVQADPSGGTNASTSSSDASELDDRESLVQVYSTQQPVYDAQPTLSPRQQHEQLLRQRNAERQRLLQQRQQQQQQQQQRQQSSHMRPVYAGSQQPGAGYGIGLRQPRQGGVLPAHQVPVYGGQHFYQPSSQPPTVFTYGSHSRAQLPFDTASYSSECPDTGIRIQINGIPCEQAVDHYGSFLCYRHEYTSRECCLRCRPLKNPSRIGCEYGDHSGRCQELQSYDCYDLRNRQSCCATCERLRQPGARAGCEYGDMTPNCDRVRQNPGLCYIPENRYLCCDTCNNIRSANDDCPWGDQNSELCTPFDRQGNIRINCYSPPIRRLCCQSCQRLHEWLPGELQGCEYGDRPVTFNTGTHRSLNCTSFMRLFGSEQCSVNEAVATNCCYTCHRYSQG